MDDHMEDDYVLDEELLFTEEGPSDFDATQLYGIERADIGYIVEYKRGPGCLAYADEACYLLADVLFRSRFDLEDNEDGLSTTTTEALEIYERHYGRVDRVPDFPDEWQGFVTGDDFDDDAEMESIASTAEFLDGGWSDPLLHPNPNDYREFGPLRKYTDWLPGIGYVPRKLVADPSIAIPLVNGDVGPNPWDEL